MSIDTADETLRLLRTTVLDPLDVYELDPIVVPVRELLDAIVGPLTHFEAGPICGNGLAWSGVDAAGRLRSGTASLDLDVREDGRSLMLGWRVEVDETAG